MRYVLYGTFALALLATMGLSAALDRLGGVDCSAEVNALGHESVRLQGEIQAARAAGDEERCAHLRAEMDNVLARWHHLLYPTGPALRKKAGHAG
jgi:hypothetical protein